MVALFLVGGAATWALWPQPWRPNTHTVWPPPPFIDPQYEKEYREAAKAKGVEIPPNQSDVAWSEYRPGFKKDIDRAGDNHNCIALKGFQEEALSDDTGETLAVTYINRWGVHLNCTAEFAQEIQSAKEDEEWAQTQNK